MIKYHPETVDIALHRIGFASKVFRRAIRGRAGVVLGSQASKAGSSHAELGQNSRISKRPNAEIHQAWAHAAIGSVEDQDVRRLDVLVQHAN